MNITYEENNLYAAFNSELEAHGIAGESLFDIYSKANSCIPEKFIFSKFCLKEQNYSAEWNSDLEGYVITFSVGKVAHTQTYTENNRLHADFGEEYVHRYDEYNDELSDNQEGIVDTFVEQINKIAYHFSS